MAGLSRAGSLKAPRFGFPLRVAGAPCRLAVAAAFAALFKSCSILAIRPCRLSTCRDSAMARAPSASMSFSIELCFRCRSSTRAASRVWSSLSLSRSTPSRSRSVAMVLRSVTSSVRSPVNFSARARNSGTTEPSNMAVRSDCSASSGLTSKAGGVRRPARCSAASTSTISARRESSEPRICCSRESSGGSRASASPILVSTLRTWAAISISCALSLLRSWPSAAISALSFACASAALFCCARVASNSCSRCLMASGKGAAVCGAVPATCADAGDRLMPKRLADNKARERGIRTADSRLLPMVPWYE